ncbi:MAG: hypothetical protein IKA17_07750 [Clostridia bacterium]|nr:hypothetical protein [Clostridia bacterium]
MKKIVSLMLSILLVCSTFASITVFADEIIVDSSNSVVQLFKTNIENQEGLVFDENYFFIGKIIGDYTNGAVGVKISTSSEKELTLGVGLAYENMGAMGLVDRKENEYHKVDISLNEPHFEPLSYWDHGTTNGYYVCATLQNPDVLEKNETVTIEIVKSVKDNSSESVSYSAGEVLNTFSKEFEGPVIFTDTDYANMASVLTDLKFERTPDYSKVVAALSSLKNDSDRTSEDDLNALLYGENNYIEVISKVITDNNNKITMANAESVAIPYAVLADIPTDDGIAYEVDVTSGIGVEKKDLPTLIEADGVNDAVVANEQVAYEIKIMANNTPISSPVITQKVIVDLPDTWDLSNGVKYLHGANWKTADIVKGKAVIYTDSFSNFVFAGKSATVASEETGRTESVKYELIQDEVDKSKFQIVATPTDGKQIIKFATTPVKLLFSTTNVAEEEAMKSMALELVEVDGIDLTNENYLPAGIASLGGVEFVATAIAGENGELKTIPVGQSLVLAELIVKGHGTFATVSSASENEKPFWMESLDNNIAVKATVEQNQLIPMMNIPEKKYTLTINMDFANRIESTDADYIGMTIEINGSISGEQETIVIGSEDMPVNIAPDGVEATSKAIELAANETYSFVVKGAGFRTFRGSVYLDANKKINLWNNAIDDGTKVNVVDDDKTTAKTVTFLVGDIYEDGIVDIYDLSAVTAYYSGDKTVDKKYVTYDLNRDGLINTADIAYVQVSYGN